MKLKKWEFVKDLGADKIEEMAIASIKNSYKETGKDVDTEIKYLYVKLKDAIGLNGSDMLFKKYLYFLASDIEFIKMVNKDYWLYTVEEIDNIDREKLEEYYYYAETEENFIDYFQI